ncbi:MAG: hypothetical protein KGZ83_05775 [Sulfuricella sp.]|nr:hypothetical protein [Sulfuricella sp.]
MEEQEAIPKKPHRPPRITARRVVGAIGFGLLAYGFDMLSVAPDATIDEVMRGGVGGILVVMLGAALAVFAVLFWG